MDYKLIGAILNSCLKSYNFQVSPKSPAGKPGKNIKSMREYRLQLINKTNDTSELLKKNIVSVIKDNFPVASNIELVSISPNSSKFSSVQFKIESTIIDAVIAKGANKGENFEVATTNALAGAFKVRGSNKEFEELIRLLGEANKDFANLEISSVKQRTGSTRKTGIPIERLGEVIGDIILTDENRKNWYVSLKDVNGSTFSAYPGAATLIKNHTVDFNSEAAEFLKTFGVDLAAVQYGYNERRNIKNPPYTPSKPVPNPQKIKKIFEQAWGMNYFYVRKKASGWQVFWIDRKMLDELTSNIKIEKITYPSKKTKSINIFCYNNKKKYLIEMRNSSGGEYPNDIKFKVLT